MKTLNKNTLRLEFALKEVEGAYVVACKMEAPVDSDDLTDRRTHSIPMTAAQQTTLRSFATKTAIPSFEEQEGIRV